MIIFSESKLRLLIHQEYTKIKIEGVNQKSVLKRLIINALELQKKRSFEEGISYAMPNQKYDCVLVAQTECAREDLFCFLDSLDIY